MSNQDIRFLLYWWFSTNVYLICGRNNRCELPKCLIEKIQDTYPNQPGVPYGGHKVTPKKKNTTKHIPYKGDTYPNP